jgi:tRNA(Ile)-lysidine synthase TilS/MesJ
MKNNLNYETFVHDNKEYLKAFRDKRVIVSYAGGKDASAILHFLLQAKEEFGFEFETHAIMYPKHIYTKDEMHRLDSYWKSRGVHITWHSISEDDSAFEIARQNGTKPCDFCHSVKRRYSFQYLEHTVTDWNSLAIIIGWSLWDIVGYTLEYLLGSVYTDRETLYQGESIKNRFFRTSQRFYPMLKMKEGYTLYKPLLKYNDQDIKQVIRENEIPILTADCKYKDFRPKRLFAESYIKMDLYFNYDKVLKFAQESLNLEKPSSYADIDKKDFITSIF